MSLEMGGRADKYGNQYENRYLARLLLRLVNEEISSVTVEPLGADSDSVEFISEHEGIKEYYQCKASNIDHDSWTIADLKRYKVFSRAKQIVLGGEGQEYFFISPLQYRQLDELCKRARTNASAREFVDYQLTSASLKERFNACANEFELNTDNPGELQQLVYLLAHCHFEQCSTGMEADRELDGRISSAFSGKAETVRCLLEQYANENGKFGIKIIAQDVVSYLTDKGHFLRNRSYDERVLPRVNTINQTKWGVYHPVFDRLLHRGATDEVIRIVQAGDSAIIHGKAGSGKSGCLQELINYLNEEHIPHLALKLDKFPPTESADEYGRRLGLLESPVYCLSKMASGKSCVLIMDQLDALRWTSSHSADALAVCKEMIMQAESINRLSEGKISVVFATRTFDLENDRGLRDLFDQGEAKQTDTMRWEKVCVSFFTPEDVVRVIGEEYNSFHPRLRKVLLVPSSLYVWSMLKHTRDRSSISTTYELMQKWWEEILKQCEEADVSHENAIACRDGVVRCMERQGVLCVPDAILSDHRKAVDVFVSCGLLAHNDGGGISFTHQSFLDYFISSDFEKRIYDGEELTQLVGNPDDQTPIIRYRLLTALQNLMESDQPMFVKQSKKLLESDSVRYYFKCAVFEVAGQCGDPCPELIGLVKKYRCLPDWRNHVNRSVFIGHPQYVTQLLSDLKEWVTDEELSLLKSVSDKVPDFVTDKLRPFALQDPERDQKIQWALCFDASADSENMFSLRCELLRNQPSLFDSFWGFSELIKKKSLRTIDLLGIQLDCWRKYQSAHLHIGENEAITEYIELFRRDIIHILFPRICDLTKDYSPQWPCYGFEQEYSTWRPEHFGSDSAIRKIIRFVKMAFEVYAREEPAELLELVANLPDAVSAVGHELIVHGICCLPTEYSDTAIQWLLDDFDNRVFVFTNENDYLHDTKQLLERFTPYCESVLFSRLERTICVWKESATEMTRKYKSRQEVNHEYGYPPVYYAYWGHLQKALLPHMDYARLSTYAKELIGVLNRNEWVQLPHFCSGFGMSEFGTVISPVESKTGRLSDKTWLQIIRTPQNRMGERFHSTHTGETFIEATHWSFSSSMGRQAKEEPERFARLALRFPEDCYSGYISGVLYALRDWEPAQADDAVLMSEVLRRFGRKKNHDIGTAAMMLIERHAALEWPEDILDLIVELTAMHSEDDADYVVTNSRDPEHKSADSLLSNAINTVRGCALRAIASLLWHHQDLGERFKETMLVIADDPSDVTRFAAMFCVTPYYNIDREFSVFLFKKLLSHDLRVLYAPGCWEVLGREYQNHADDFFPMLKEASESDMEDLAERAAGYLCAVAVFCDNPKALEFLFSHPFSEKQKSKISQQAASSFESEKYHESSERILLYLLDNSSEELIGFRQLFLDHKLVLQRDMEFLCRLMESRQSESLLYSFLEYLNESDEDICVYAPVLERISKTLAQAPVQSELRLSAEDLVKCVVRLFDRGQNQPDVRRISLDIFDNLFMSDLGMIHPLADMIDAFD